jgi:hypothetical protein
MVRWIYPAERDWAACEKCHAAIEADDRERPCSTEPR